MISEEGENTMAKTKVICFTNNKGGSGKTTTCSNVGFGLRELGKKVLMIDGDMQLNLSLSLFDEDTVLAYAQSEKNLYEAIKRQDDLTDYIVNTKYEGLDLIPASTLMSSIEYELFTYWQREYILNKGLIFYSMYSSTVDAKMSVEGESMDLRVISEALYKMNYDIKREKGFTFHSYDTNMHDIRSVFVINNKRFVCKECTYIIDSFGRKGAWEGIFYPISMSDTEVLSRWILTDGKWRDGGIWLDNGRWLDE